MRAYFSHSYRDVPINTYFSGLFEQAGIELRADQKTDVWCVAKLERYMFDMDGFVSIIPQRVRPDAKLEYSPYIGRELMLARRARTPRVLFVDDQILDTYKNEFPANAIPFFRDAPETEQSRHVEAISEFRRSLASRGTSSSRRYAGRQVTIITGAGVALRDGTSRVAAILRSRNYNPTVVSAPSGLDEAFDDIASFESLIASELCVFVLGTRLSYSDVLLAMAHAHCVPSMRLRRDAAAPHDEPDLSGTVRWSSTNELATSFGQLLANYDSVFATATRDQIQQLSTPAELSPSLALWDPSDRIGLVVHIIPDDPYVRDRADGVMRNLAQTQSGRVHSDAVCRDLYDRVKRDRFYYTFEPVLTQSHGQRIRRPKEIDALNCATCIDLACLFAALLEAVHERVAVIVVRIGNTAHALAAYITADAALGNSAMTLGDLRGAIRRGEIIPFETTGAVEARGRTVGAETEGERKEGQSMLDYRTAKIAGERLLTQRDVELTHFVDVQESRQRVR